MQQVDVALEELSKKIPPYLMALDAMIPDGANLLFVRQTSLDLLKRFKDRNLDISIIDRNVNNAAIYQKYSISAYVGEAYTQLSRFERGQFDYIIFDNSLTTFSDMSSIVSIASVISEHIIFILDNVGYWKNRLRFLLTGSFFHSTGNILWYNTKHIRYCNVNEFVSFCSDMGLIVERGCYFNKNGVIYNLYDIKRMPSIFAEKLLFIAGHRDNYIGIVASNES